MHIDARSWFSFHDGVAAPEMLCAKACELGYDTLGLADIDGTYGLISFYRSALSCGLKPLLGLSLTDPRLATVGVAPARPSSREIGSKETSIRNGSGKQDASG